MSQNRNPLVITHRTNCAAAPENSMSGIRAAVELGVDKIEMDVQRSRDGILVLMHDLKVDRTTNGSGKLREIDHKQIAKLQLLSDKFPGEKIPLLEEVFAFVAPTQTGFLLEVKSPKHYPGIGADLVRLVIKYNMEERVEILCFDWDFLRQLKLDYPFLQTCALSSLPFMAKPVDTFDVLGIYYRSLLFRSALGFSLPREKRIYAGTPISEKAFRGLIEVGVDGIITDEPELLMRILGGEGQGR